jgi:hypothetical protein
MISPPSTVKNAQLWRKRCRKVRALAQRIIDGKIGVIEGSIQMGAFQTWLHAHEEKEFRIFRAVYSASTDLPIGKVRELWEPEALREKDEEIRKIEIAYRARVIKAAAAIKERYQSE